MLKAGLFCLFVPFALAEMFYHHSFGLIIVGTLYISLSLQADYAAGRLLRNGLVPAEAEGGRRRRWNEAEEESEPIPVQPLGPGAPGFRERAPEAQPAAPAPEPVKSPSGLAQARRKAEPGAARPVPKALPASPNFSGSDHELLGIGENARTRTILHAFRHWIKRFHPDRNRSLPEELANARVIRITRAKDRLLEARRRFSGRAA